MYGNCLPERHISVMNTISAKGKTIIGINIILCIIGLPVHVLYFDMRINSYIVYGMLLLMIVDVIVLFSKYLPRVLKTKELEPRLIIYFTIPLISLIVSYINDIIKGRVFRRGSVRGAYDPSSNHPFYGWFRSILFCAV